MKNRIAISQSNYIPWLGFFELASRCDTLVFLESVQYTKNDWRNRNLIRINEIPHWLTIPVRTKNSLSLAINEVNIVDQRWFGKHLTSIRHAYSDSNSKRNLDEFLKEIYTSEVKNMKKLSEINIYILHKIFSALEIKVNTLIYSEKDFLSKQERVFHICKELNASEYLTSFKGKGYLEDNVFLDSKINIELITYEKSKQFLKDSGNSLAVNYSIIDTVARFGLAEVKGFLKNGQ